MRPLLDAIVGRVTKSYVAVVRLRVRAIMDRRPNGSWSFTNNSRRKDSQDRRGRETPLPKKQLLQRGRVAAANSFHFPYVRAISAARNHQMWTQMRRSCHLQQSSTAYYPTGRALQISRRIMTLMGRVRKSAWTLDNTPTKPGPDPISTTDFPSSIFALR